MSYSISPAVSASTKQTIVLTANAPTVTFSGLNAQQVRLTAEHQGTASGSVFLSVNTATNLTDFVFRAQDVQNDGTVVTSVGSSNKVSEDLGGSLTGHFECQISRQVNSRVFTENSHSRIGSFNSFLTGRRQIQTTGAQGATLDTIVLTRDAGEFTADSVFTLEVIS